MVLPTGYRPINPNLPLREIVDELEKYHTLPYEHLETLLSAKGAEIEDYLFERARAVATRKFGNKIFVRGLIEFSNYCKQNCLYCGLRRGNRKPKRYRLSKAEILACCEEGHRLGFRTFVLQSGEDDFYTTEIMTDIIRTIRAQFPDCAITISVGEKDRATYQAYFDAGANRYLLRHESSNFEYYSWLHSEKRTLTSRWRCLEALKEIGFQVGSGFMVGLPEQGISRLIEDIYFLKQLEPEMIGIGPYLVSKDTPFKDEKSGSMELTLRLLAILRLMFPNALLPATTALGSIHPEGREKGILAGANVLMPNLSPAHCRDKYKLYDDKICIEDKPSQCIGCLQGRLHKIGYEISYERGDYDPTPPRVQKSKSTKTRPK